MATSRTRVLFLSLISIGLIAAFVWYLYKNADKYRALLQMPPLSVALLVALSSVFMVVDGTVNVRLLKIFGVSLCLRDGIFLSGTSALANQLPVSGGIISKAYYLKNKYGLAYTKFAAAILALFFCFLAVNGAVGSVVLLYWRVREKTVPFFLIIGFLTMVSTVVVFRLPINQKYFPEKITERLAQALEGWSLINRNPRLMLELISLQLGMMALLAIRYWLAFHMLSQDVTPSQAVLFAAATVLTQLVSFAPGGLGIREGIVAGVASLLGFDMGVSVVAVGLDRLVSTLMIVLVGGIGLLVLGKQISESKAET